MLKFSAHSSRFVIGLLIASTALACLAQQPTGVPPHWYRGGDVIIAHMNKPQSETAEGLSTGLLALLRRGLVFVRLDEVDLVQTNQTPSSQGPPHVE